MTQTLLSSDCAHTFEVGSLGTVDSSPEDARALLDGHARTSSAIGPAHMLATAFALVRSPCADYTHTRPNATYPTVAGRSGAARCADIRAGP